MPKKHPWPFLGNETLGVMLMDAITDRRLPSVVLFSGPAHTGKTTAARWLAQRDICTASVAPCGICVDCRAIEGVRHPRVLELGYDRESVGVDEIRDVLRRFSTAIVETQHEWVILSEAGKLTEPAVNALLKFLEEPPTHVTIVMTSSAPDTLLPTLRSRAAEFRWHLVPEAELLRYAERLDNPLPLELRRALVARALNRPGILLDLLRTEESRTDEQQTSTAIASAWSEGSDSAAVPEDPRRALPIAELLLRDVLLLKAGTPSRLGFAGLQTVTQGIADNHDWSTLLTFAERYLNRETYEHANVQPQLLWNDLQLA